MNEQDGSIAKKLHHHMRVLHKDVIDSTGIPVVMLDTMVLMATTIGGRVPASDERFDLGPVVDRLMMQIRSNRNELNVMCENLGGHSPNDGEWKRACTAAVLQAWVYCVTVEAMWSLPREYRDLPLYQALARSAIGLVHEALRPSERWCDLVAKMHFKLFPDLVAHYHEMHERAVSKGIVLPASVGWRRLDIDK